MADVEVSVGGRTYNIACRAGGEAHLQTIAAHVDRKASEARAAVGDVNETRQLLFAALLLADEIAETAARVVPPPADPRIAKALEHIADRIEAVADIIDRP